MIRRYLAGETNPVGLHSGPDGNERTRDQIMAIVHELTEAWVRRRRDRTVSGVVTLGQAVRAETLALPAGLADEQPGETLPGGPWADGTNSGVLGSNAAHATMHWEWLTAVLAVTS